MSELLPDLPATPERLFRTQIALLEAFQNNQHVLMQGIAAIVDEFRAHMLAEIETEQVLASDLTARLGAIYTELATMKVRTDSFRVAMADQIARDQEQMDLRDRVIVAIQQTLQQLSATTVEQQSELGHSRRQVAALGARVDALADDVTA